MVVVAAVFEGHAAGEVLAFRRAPGEHHAGRWEFPGGKVEPGESAEEALRRELHEELGVDVTVAAALWTGTLATDTGGQLTISFHPVRLEAGTLALTVHDAVLSVDPRAAADVDWAPLDRRFCEHLASLP